MKNFNWIDTFGTCLSNFFLKAVLLILLLAGGTQAHAQLTPPYWDTAFGTNGGSYDNGGGINVDRNNNVYTAFRYNGTVSLGEPPHTATPVSGGGTPIGTAMLTNNLWGNWATKVQNSGGYDYIIGAGLDADHNSYAGGIINSGGGWYCAQTNVAGGLAWYINSTNAGGYVSGICGSGAHLHTYIAGIYNYSSTMTVLGHSISSGPGGGDGFILKVDSLGQWDANSWLVNLPSAWGDATFADKCATDYAGHLWVCGGYSGSPTLGTFTLPNSGNSSYYNLFVAELDTATGNILQVYTAANAGSSSPWAAAATNLGGIVIDSANNIYISGPFMHTATWGTFSATCVGPGPNHYVAKLKLLPGTTTYKWDWVQTNTSPNAENGIYSLTIDKNWDITAAGGFVSSATFGVTTITGSSAGSICIAKYASGNGAMLYAMTAGGSSNVQINASGVAADTNRLIFVSGTYTGQSYADPSFTTSGTPIVIPYGGSESAIFVAKLDSTPSLRIIPNPDTSYCAGQCYSLPYTALFDSATGAFRPGNIFTAQLSDVNGSFASGGLNLGTFSSTTSGNIPICFPDTLTPGSNYQLRITSSNPAYCSIVKGNTITIKSTPVPALSVPPTICKGDSALLTAGGGVSYSWYNGSTSTAVMVIPDSTTTYSVSVSNGSCSKDTAITVTVNPLPAITLSGITSFCQGDSTTIRATGGGTYLWGNGSTNDSATFAPASTITDTLKVTRNGCSADTTVTITVNPVPTPGITQNKTICQGNFVSLSASGGSSYVWNTGQTSDSIFVSPPSTTTYTVTISNGSCSATDSAKVTVVPFPPVTANGTTTITSGQITPLIVTPGAGDTYLWTPSSSLSCDTCRSPNASPTVTTWYYVTVTDSDGCSTTDSVLVTVKENCGSIYLPNAFSPNNDGYNDVLYVYGDCIKDMDLNIYDRWGNKVFESNNINEGWDGKYNGQPMNAGTYVYTLTVTDNNNNTTTKKGNITLVR